MPLLIVTTPFTEPRPDWGRPVRWFWFAYVIARIRAWYADHLSDRYASSEIGIQYAVADRFALSGVHREIVDHLAADGGRLSIAPPKDNGQLCISTTENAPREIE